MATINQVEVGLSGSTGSGAFVGSTSPTITSPSLITPALGVATATSLAFSSTSEIIGVTNNTSAASGSVGQIVSALVSGGAATSLTTNVTANAVTLSVPAGDWDVWGELWTAVDLTTSLTNIQWGITTTSATFNTQPSANTTYNSLTVPYTVTYSPTLFGGICRVTSSSTTTVFLCVQMTFTIANAFAYGVLTARRRR